MKRWLSIKDQKFFKYSKYAIGEILIVIIGIIVALLLHNWNEKRKDQNFFDITLVEVEKELIENIKAARWALDFYNDADSAAVRILYDSLTFEDYDAPYQGRLLREMIFLAYGPEIKDNAFKKLSINSQNITPQQDSVTKGLMILYNDSKSPIDEISQRVLDLAVENIKAYQKLPWYKDMRLALNRDEAIEFFLNNSEHIGRVTAYAELGIYHHRKLIEIFDIAAVKCYRSICEYLEEKGLKHCSSPLFT
jgi:hypothetical protein